MAKLTKLLTATDEIRKSFTMIPNCISYEHSLSAKAWGLLIKILMLPDDWDFSEAGLATHFKDSRDSIASGLRELEAAGYLYREQRRINGRLGSSDYTVSDVPRRDFMNAYYERERKKKGKAPLPELPELNLSNAFEQMTSAQPYQCAPLLEIPTTGAPSTECAHNNIINNTTLKNNKFNNSGRVAHDAERIENCCSSKTGGVGEAKAESTPDVLPLVSVCASTHEPDFNFINEKDLKTLKKRYKSAFVNYALELSQDKEKPLVYAKALLNDWKKQNLQTIQEVQRYVASFEDEKAPALTIKPYVSKPRRVEQIPDWLGQEQQAYDANRQFTPEEQQRVARMQQLQSNLLDHQAIANAEAKLPF